MGRVVSSNFSTMIMSILPVSTPFHLHCNHKGVLLLFCFFCGSQ